MGYYMRAVFLGTFERYFYSWLWGDGHELVLQYPSGRPHKNYTGKFLWNLKADLKNTKAKEFCKKIRWEF